VYGLSDASLKNVPTIIKMKSKPLLRFFVEIAILAVVYHLAARVGLQMAYVQQNTSPVWPPSGIALAALLIFGIRDWPGITLGVVIGSLLTGAPPGLAVGFGIANTLEALIGASILTRWIRFDRGINRVRDVIGLVFAAACGTSISATIGVATLIVFQNIPLSAFPTLWITWFIGNLLGCLVVTPLLLTWVHDFPRHWKRARKVEALIFLLLLVLVSLYVFVNPSGAGALHQALIYLIFPFAIWAALRLEQVGASSTVFIVSGIAIWGTIHEVGPFAGMPVNDSLILLQTFTGVLALMSLTLAASASEQRRAEDTLRNQVEELAALNDASRLFLENTEKQTLADAICRLAVDRFDLPAVWIDPIPIEEKPANLLAAYPAFLQTDGQLAELHTLVPELRQRSLDAGRTGLAGVFHSQFAFQPADAGISAGKPLRSFAFFPLLYGKEEAGILIIASDGPGSFSKEQMLLLQSYANLAAIALQNSWLFDQVRMGNEQLHALSHRLMEVQEEERIHLSRELHDESGQVLAGLMMNLGLLERDAESPALVRSHAAELKRIASEVLDNLHSLAVKLRPASLDHLGLVTALEQYIQEFNRQYQLDVQFETVGIDESRLPVELESALFRIVQESLTNVVLHAHATQVDVLLNRRNGVVVLTVEDNGIGFNPNQPVNEARLGLFGMRERVEMLSGKLIIESAPGKGTMISVEVPDGDTHLDRG
jgi:signal transduction histidine kinase